MDRSLLRCFPGSLRLLRTSTDLKHFMGETHSCGANSRNAACFGLPPTLLHLGKAAAAFHMMGLSAPLQDLQRLTSSLWQVMEIGQILLRNVVMAASRL